MFEIEQKFHVQSRAALESKLRLLAVDFLGREDHWDTYYNHPCRDFAKTKEALRVRRIDGVPHITYKGPKIPGNVKARRELEWQLSPGDCDGAKSEELLVLLGFVRVADVKKKRSVFKLNDLNAITIVIDEVEDLGLFAEIERVIQDVTDVENARQEIMACAEQLELSETEPRSYLRMLLEKKSPNG